MLLPYLNENVVEAGCDEAGRGCLAIDIWYFLQYLNKNKRNYKYD